MDRLKLDNVSKKFDLILTKQQNVLQALKGFFEGKKSRQFFALKDISFNVREKEVIGIIGKNGSGKSTLLRTIAGIYKEDSGLIEINGKVVYISGFGLGAQDRLTMTENIYLIGLFFGISKKETKEKFEKIVKFSGLKEFVNVELYKFSSGMMSRLAFSTTVFLAAHSKPDIILIDEAFDSGGDGEFKEKSLRKMEELIGGGAAVLLASHDLEMLKKYCGRILLLDKGKIIKQGNPAEVINFYLNGGRQ